MIQKIAKMATVESQLVPLPTPTKSLTFVRADKMITDILHPMTFKVFSVVQYDCYLDDVWHCSVYADDHLDILVKAKPIITKYGRGRDVIWR